jgi:lipopolysaccharide transport system ATP-binding protein
MITVDQVSKTFKLYRKPSDRLKEIVWRKSFHKRFHAVDKISFGVGKGETLGIIGENGAGKSTILKLLTGILIPDTGVIRISGRITGLLELGTGFNPEFSGIDNIIHNATYLGLSRDEINRKMDRIIRFTELGEFIHEPIKTYSSGMTMRLAFSVAIHAEPRAFVVDEALSVGDAYFQQKCMKKIRNFKENGGAIVFVSHDMNAVKVLCDNAILLDQGRIVEYGDPESVINHYNFLVARRSRGEEIQYRDREKNSGYGNHKAMIRSVAIFDARGMQSDILMSGRPASVTVRITAEQTLPDLTLGIMIRDRFGQDIFGTNSFFLKKPIHITRGKTLIATYAFSTFNLGPGKYSVTAALHKGPSHVDECIHWMDGSAVFEVVAGDGPVFSGLVRMTPDLTVNDAAPDIPGDGTRPDMQGQPHD